MEIKELYAIFQQHPVITTDSRDVPEGSLFFALKGETFDGNQYAVASLEKGAAYAVVDDKDVYESYAAKATTQSAETAAEVHRLILVDNVLKTLQDLAHYHRCQLGTTIVGVTGTNGKTTTKELIAAVLSKKYNILYTQGNFNNHIGVPKTLLKLTKEHELAVIEMGANHPGEIKTLVDIVLPDYGIITNVGKAHLEGFGSFEGVIKTKGELYDFLRSDNGTAFINNNNPHLLKIADGLRLVRYGRTPESTKVEAEGGNGAEQNACGNADLLLVSGQLIECNPFLKFAWKVQHSPYSPMEVQTKLIGSYNIDNALAAACIGTLFCVSADDITAALSEYTPSNNRSQLTVTTDNRLVVDAYNANPTSMAAALDNFRLMKVDNKMCILGDMKELGDASREEHIKVLNTLLESDFARIWLVGSEFKDALDTLADAPACITTFANVDEVKAAIAADKPKGYTILIKGSNSTKLIQTVELL